MRARLVIALGSALVMAFVMGMWIGPTDASKPVRELRERPESLVSVQRLRETDVHDEGLSVGFGDAIPYASSLVRGRAEALVDHEVYIKMLMYDITEGGEHRGVELRVKDVADRRLLDEVAKKVGERRGFRMVVAGWERYEWCTLVEHDLTKGLLTVKTANGERVTGCFFGSGLPPGKVFRVVTVDASGSPEEGVAVYFTGIVSIEAVKE